MSAALKIQILTILVAGLALAGCGTGDDPLQALLPGLSETESRAINHLDGDELTGWALNTGADRLIVLQKKMVESLYADPAPTPTQKELLQTGMHKLGHLLAGLFHCPEFHAQHLFLGGMDRQQAVHLLGQMATLKTTFADPDLALAEKSRLIADQHLHLADQGYDLGVCRALGYRAILALKAGDPQTYLDLNRSLLDFARSKGIVTAECDARSNLLMVRLHLDPGPAILEEINESLSVALRSRLGRRASRLLIMTGVHFIDLGHYSTATEYFDRAIATIREFGSHAHALAPISYKLRMYAIMGCWSQVERLLPQARLLLNEIIATEEQDISNRLSSVRLQELSGRCLLARGQVEQAHAVYLAAWNEAAQLPYEEGSLVCNYWLTGLLDNSRPDLAREALVAVRRSGCLADITVQQARLPFFQARLCFQEGQMDSARHYLQEFAAVGLTQPQLTDDLFASYHALNARLLHSDNQVAALAALTDGFNFLLSLLRESELGPEAYMDLCRYQELRWAAHDLFGQDPVNGYGLELLWRRLLAAANPHSSEPLLGKGEDAVSAARRLARTAVAAVAAADADHCLYQVRATGITRWLVSDGRIVCEALTVPVADLRAEVASAIAAMAVDPGNADATVGPVLAADLARLADHLLPDQILAAGQVRPLLLVTGDGFLAQIPFAPLNVGTGEDYEPLVAHRDVTWVRNPAQAGPRSSTSAEGLFVADPRLDPATARRFRLSGGLAGAEREITAAFACSPTARILRNEEATLQAVQAGWENASLLYFLGHVIHNPEAPYLTWLPLAGPQETGPTTHHHGLDIKDILMADLRGCELVILSGCDSGASFVDELTTTPSLGDAFLDAGAGASIQSFWKVRDQAAILQPDSILCLWREGDLNLIQAVSEARRQALRGPHGVRHPFGWAAYSLKSQGI